MTAKSPASDNLLAVDLDFIVLHAAPSLEQLRGQRIFITGGTGFFGTWLLESFAWANRVLELEATAVVLTRDFKAFQKKAPHLASDGAFQFLQGDICDFQFPQGRFLACIHAATESTSQLNATNPGLLLRTIFTGTDRVLTFAAQAQCRHFLLTSSGAVYGPQPEAMTHIPETYLGAPATLLPTSAYGEGKRVAELLTSIAAKQHGFTATIARCFAFVGPYLPLDVHYAMGNFIRDGLGGQPLKIQGDGTAVRSYLYASDLMIWLWTLLVTNSDLQVYNVGSAHSVSIKETAEAVSRVFISNPKIEVAIKPPLAAPPSRYVPCVDRIEKELGLVERVNLGEAIKKTVDWNLNLNLKKHGR